MTKKPVLLSGIQPTGNLTIGNYIGAMRNWVALQDECDCLFVLVDLHTITIRQDPADLLRRCYEFLALYIACGIDPAKNTIFVQSHVPGHAQLAWILNCFTYVGELNRMTQFRDKAKRHADNVNAGLFDYPVLMAADILLYGSNLVPIGEDQKQHLELTRNVAERFNRIHGDVFTMPEAHVPEVGARIRSLQDPTAKMSKTAEDPNNYVALLDDAHAIRRKIKRAVTDSGSEIVYDEARPGISNLMTIHSCLTGEPLDLIASRYAGKGYGHFKNDLSEAIIEFLRPIQARYHDIRGDEDSLRRIIGDGARAARERARPMLERVHEALGFIPAAEGHTTSY